ncbi:hypothetical protein RRG08_040634 [Elysia crispata]|uniref:Uncharacterized protein n=1 Tax=Elysia crispata TaxID=231223 RepID=A0AAE1B356_9GAST|nr:hypothetical protein RRG08_040634 [Elysia crispata]
MPIENIACFNFIVLQKNSLPAQILMMIKQTPSASNGLLLFDSKVQSPKYVQRKTLLTWHAVRYLNFPNVISKGLTLSKPGLTDPNCKYESRKAIVILISIILQIRRERDITDVKFRPAEKKLDYMAVILLPISTNIGMTKTCADDLLYSLSPRRVDTPCDCLQTELETGRETTRDFKESRLR